MKNQDWEKDVNTLLKGIDSADIDDAWWETSTGAEFGAKKLTSLKVLIQKTINAEVRRALNAVDVKDYPESFLKETPFQDGANDSNALWRATKKTVLKDYPL